MGNRMFSHRVDPNSKPAVLVCDDTMEELKKARDLLMADGYEVVTMLAFPSDEKMNADRSDVLNRPEWLSGYFHDFDELLAVMKDPALALRDADLPQSVVMVLSDGVMGAGKTTFEGVERAKMGVTLAKILDEQRLDMPMAIFTGEQGAGSFIMQEELGDLAMKVDVVAKGDVAKAAMELTEREMEKGTIQAVLPGDDTENAQYFGTLDEAPSRAIGA